MNLTAAVEERNGVALVELEVENSTRTTRRVRIQNELSGVLLPPRRHGSVVEGFDEEGVTVTIAAGGHRAIGYACRAEAESPPATLVGSEPCDPGEVDERSADDILVALGDPRPPRDAVTPEIRSPGPRTEETNANGRSAGTTDLPTNDSAVRNGSFVPQDEADPRSNAQEADSSDSGSSLSPADGAQTEPKVASTHSRAAPPALDAWLNRAAERLESGEPVDAARLRTVAERADSLAHRAGR